MTLADRSHSEIENDLIALDALAAVADADETRATWSKEIVVGLYFAQVAIVEDIRCKMEKLRHRNWTMAATLGLYSEEAREKAIAELEAEADQ